MGKMMFVGAHPDDETFMMGTTLAKYAAEGHEIKVVCATRGEGGQWSDVAANGKKLEDVREAEHKNGLEILGIKAPIEYLGFVDGTLSNVNVAELADKVTKTVNNFQPDVLITSDLNGISGHIDHIVMAITATYVYQRIESVKKLYYFVLPQDEPTLEKRVYWGRDMKEITTFVDVEKWIPKKIEAALCHKTQKKDTDFLIPFWKNEITDHFILAGSRVKSAIPEKDLWDGIS